MFSGLCCVLRIFTQVLKVKNQPWSRNGIEEGRGEIQSITVSIPPHGFKKMIENHVPRNVTWFRGQEKPQLETSWKESRDLSPTTKESDCVSPRKQGGNQPCSVSAGRIWHCQQTWLHCMGSMPELTCRTVQVKSAFFFFYTTKLIVLRKKEIENEYRFLSSKNRGRN